MAESHDRATAQRGTKYRTSGSAAPRRNPAQEEKGDEYFSDSEFFESKIGPFTDYIVIVEDDFQTGGEGDQLLALIEIVIYVGQLTSPKLSARLGVSPASKYLVFAEPFIRVPQQYRDANVAISINSRIQKNEQADQKSCSSTLSIDITLGGGQASISRSESTGLSGTAGGTIKAVEVSGTLSREWTDSITVTNPTAMLNIPIEINLTSYPALSTFEFSYVNKYGLDKLFQGHQISNADYGEPTEIYARPGLWPSFLDLKLPNGLKKNEAIIQELNSFYLKGNLGLINALFQTYRGKYENEFPLDLPLRAKANKFSEKNWRFVLDQLLWWQDQAAYFGKFGRLK